MAEEILNSIEIEMMMMRLRLRLLVDWKWWSIVRSLFDLIGFFLHIDIDIYDVDVDVDVDKASQLELYLFQRVVAAPTTTTYQIRQQ